MLDDQDAVEERDAAESSGQKRSEGMRQRELTLGMELRAERACAATLRAASEKGTWRTMRVLLADGGNQPVVDRVCTYCKGSSEAQSKLSLAPRCHLAVASKTFAETLGRDLCLELLSV